MHYKPLNEIAFETLLIKLKKKKKKKEKEKERKEKCLLMGLESGNAQVVLVV